MAADTPAVVALAQPVAVVVEPTRVAGVAIAAGGQGPPGIPGPVGPAGPAALTRDTFLTYPFGEGNGVYFNDLQLGEVLSLPHLTPVAPGVQSSLYHPQASLTQSGTGAGLETLGVPISMRLITGSTTAGQAALSLHSLEPNQVWRPGATDGWSASAVVSLSALSSTYERFVAVLTLFTLSAGGLYCSYSDNLNGGRWRLAYQDAAYKTVYVDTGITPRAWRAHHPAGALPARRGGGVPPAGQPGRGQAHRHYGSLLQPGPRLIHRRRQFLPAVQVQRMGAAPDGNPAFGPAGPAKLKGGHMPIITEQQLLQILPNARTVAGVFV
uniref:hypothetical protein n=1 Tax=Metapseudomonas otitidis TaxID=319939 RepID=UPI0013F68404